MLVFRERINRWQQAALVLAVGAVVLLTVSVGAPPYIALALAVTFAFYGLVKKVVTADPRVSVAVETLIALPIAGGYVVALELTHRGHFLSEGRGTPVCCCWPVRSPRSRCCCSPRPHSGCPW